MRSQMRRLQPYAMLGIDLAVPVVVMSAVGHWVGKPEAGMAIGFGLGLLAYFRHWTRMDKQAVDFKWIPGKGEANAGKASVEHYRDSDK